MGERRCLVLFLVLFPAMVMTGVSRPAGASLPFHDNGRIVFTQNNFRFTQPEVASVKADGSARATLVRGRGFHVSPAYSPDGQRIAFTSSRSQPRGFQGNELIYSELYVMDDDGSHIRRLTFSAKQIDYEPSWSPDGQRIVFSRGSSTTPPGEFLAPTDLWIIDLVSGQEHQVTNSPDAVEINPQWSPDGSRIAFDGDVADPGNNDVYTVRTNGTQLRRLTTQPGWDGNPSYSPDSRLIAFDSDRAGNSEIGTWEIYIMRADGSGTRRLTHHPNDDSQPTFSPSGRSIAFASDRDGRPDPGFPGYRVTDIFRMRVDGTHLMNLTQTPSRYEFDSDWQPR